MKCPKPNCKGERLEKKQGKKGSQIWGFYYCPDCDDEIAEQAVINW